MHRGPSCSYILHFPSFEKQLTSIKPTHPNKLATTISVSRLLEILFSRDLFHAEDKEKIAPCRVAERLKRFPDQCALWHVLSSLQSSFCQSFSQDPSQKVLLL
mmetsp:Transcript_21559/g.44994  ORF Transcript_21559/g.44994 Transcript_21559/m.44994 type:complete len:103 (+) Transcript_21559:1577-1885(+)